MSSMQSIKPVAALVGALVIASLAVQAAEEKKPATGAYESGGKGMRTMEMMNAMDGNKDKKLSKDEFMKHHERMFDMMDRNKDGMISQEEWLEKQRKLSDG
jgi:EF hand